MPRIKINYQNTIIYKIVCNDINVKDLYIGSTTDFKRRKSEHKRWSLTPLEGLYRCIFNNGGWSNWSMIEIEKYSCNDGNEAKKRERFWIEELKATLNIIKKPILTEDERINYNIDRKNKKIESIKNIKNDELLSWFIDNYEKTNNKKDIIKLKEIYDNFSHSDYFYNLNKDQRKGLNYKNFIERIKNNISLKKFIKKNNHNVYIITNYKPLNNNDNNNYIDENTSLDL